MKFVALPVVTTSQSQTGSGFEFYIAMRTARQLHGGEHDYIKTATRQPQLAL